MTSYNPFSHLLLSSWSKCVFVLLFIRTYLPVKKGKTEALFRFNGKGAKSSRHKPFVEDQGKILVQVSGKSLALVATSNYKHVGTITCSTGTMQPEITAKLSAMHATFKQLHPAFLGRSTVLVEKRLQLCRSILFYQLCTRPS